MTQAISPLHARYMNTLHAMAERALSLYDLPTGSTATLLNLSENATYRVDAPDGRRWALRVHRHGYQTERSIASELAWAMDLRSSGVAITPSPIAGRTGTFVQRVSHPDIGARFVVLFAWEDGSEPAIGDDLTQAFETLGETAARMHIHARQWRRPEAFTRLTWDFDSALGDERPHWGQWRRGIGMTPEGKVLFQRTVDVIGRRLRAYGRGAERFGLIHCDLRLANLLIDGPTVKVIDFDDCGFSWYMYDAATPVSFHEHAPQVPELVESWKTGYRRVLPLSLADETEIPTFIMLRRILLVAWVASHIEADYPRSLGAGFTEGTLPLCEEYLRKFG